MPRGSSGGSLSLSRMVAVEKDERDLKHIGKPLRRQMNHMIDRTRWPVLVTYSDEGQGHNGFVYQCSGWTPTTRRKSYISENTDGARCSSYSNGKSGKRDLVRNGHTWIQRWESRICDIGQALTWMTDHGWQRVAIPGKRWANGKQAHAYVRVTAT